MGWNRRRRDGGIKEAGGERWRWEERWRRLGWKREVEREPREAEKESKEAEIESGGRDRVWGAKEDPGGPR